MAELRPIHPRQLIRRAVTRVILEHPGCAALLAERVFPNRLEPWLAYELPACGVYTLEEENLESNIHPDPLERRLSLGLEALAQAREQLDDDLDALCLPLEQALQLDAIGKAMGAIVDEARAAAGLPGLTPVKKDGCWRHPADTLLLLRLSKTELGIAVEGEREIGVARLNFNLEYGFPEPQGDLADFLLGCADWAAWDAAPADGNIDMQSRVEFPAPEETDKEQK